MRLADKVILITGSTTGIGAAIARRCVAEGARVLAHGRDQERAARIAAELGPRASYYLDDLADPAAPRRLVEAAITAFGKLDALVNNAAYVARSNLATTDAALFDKIIATNLRAPLLLIKHAVDYLAPAQGCVLNIGSLNAYCGEANLLPYSISKGGLVTLSRNLADALGPRGVRVNHFNVGWVLTENELHYKIADGLPENWPDQVPRATSVCGRLMKPEEIAAAAIYWLSDESRPISGSIVDLEQYPFVGRNPAKEVDD